jgi:uncharacterized protein (DUF2336 family)
VRSDNTRGSPMIVRQFLHWVRTAPAGERAEATGALARAYLYSDLTKEDRAAAEGAMIMLLDDASPLVRRALAQALAGSADAPHAVIHALAADHADIAALVLARSPLLIDAELVDVVDSGNCDLQAAIASRVPLQGAVAAALAEVGTLEACLVALENPQAAFTPASFDRLVTRFGRVGTVREAMFARADLPMAARHVLVGMLSSLLADFVVDREWLARTRADQVVRDARDRGTVTIAALGPDPDTRPLVRHLRASGQLTAGLVLRALLSGHVAMFEEVLAELSGLPLGRVQGLVHGRGAAGFRAVYEKAGMPPSVFPAFREAVTALGEASSEDAVSSRLKRQVVERVLAQCEHADAGDIEPLLILLRRYAAEAAREDARAYCEELVADERLAVRDRAAA